jgi:hypothetical protein
LFQKIKSSFIDLAEFAQTESSFNKDVNSLNDPRVTKSAKSKVVESCEMIENDSKTHTNSEEHCLRTKKASLSSSSSRKRFRASIGEKEMSLLND